MPSIFVNYRRNDSEGEAGRLFDELTLHFGTESVFMDVAAIEPGQDFRKAIDRSVAACSVLLAIIGQAWLESKDALGQPRLADANDFVRIELASALRRDIPVVPVLVRGAKMPRVDQLPDDLKELAYRNAAELSHARWKSDVQVLIRSLEPMLNISCPEAYALRDRGESQPSPQTSGSAKIDSQTLERVSRGLAAYIGPISDVVVRRAAKRCSSINDLYDMVAREIDSEADRTKFLKSRR